MKSFLTAFLLAATTAGFAQEALNYQVPPQEILELVKVDRAPGVIMDSKNQTMVFLYSGMYKTIEEISGQELKLAGLRINPKTNSLSGERYFTRISIQLSRDGSPVFVKGLPENARLTNISWSPDERWIACTNIAAAGLELWLIDVQKQVAKKLSNANLNGNLGSPYKWFGDSQSLLVRLLPANRPAFFDAAVTVPSGPSVSVSDGSKAQNRTYQDLLKNKVDEQNFELLATSELHKVGINGASSLWKAADMHSRESFSPDGKYVLITTIKRPFSYIVTYSSFPTTTGVYDQNGKLVRTIHEKPLTDNLPKGFMAVQKGKRQIGWRDDQPATLYWAEALDEGDPAIEVTHRDEIFTWQAPFADNGWKSVLKTPQRYAGIIWGRSDAAIVYDSWYNTRNEKTYLFNPSDPSKGLTVLFDRNSQDEYSNPGNFETVRNAFGRDVLRLEGTTTYMTGDGYTAQGQFPFVNAFDLQSKKTKTLYRSAYTNKLENIIRIIDLKKGELLVRIESPSEYPNYYVRKMSGKAAPVAITSFENPFKKIEGISKEVITYRRADGLELTATLYLPAGYDKTKKEKLPMVMWAYPQEFKDKNSASQNTTNPNEFIFPYYGSPIYWVTRGYAILDNAAFPIVGEGTAEPNDSFIEQLVANAKAAIDAVDSLGYIDRRKVAVGGHSYGAFMTANLLTHSDLFAAGIARSGAYNRSLTPFGFQGEERNYWEAQDTYNEMSPFNYADKMKTPMLLVHGENDNNPGTFPIQSERYFAALKGFGAPVRLVVLPKESHGYAAIESILHLLWEQDQWLEKYVKNRPAGNE
jgi:dipeptidyl aminopeptidase/acylaminoacyl peptidase